MTGELITIPDSDDGALVEEAHRIAEALRDTVTDVEFSVISLALDGVTDPDMAAQGSPDEVRHVVRESGTFASGAAGVRARAAGVIEAIETPRVILLPDTPDGADVASSIARGLRGGCVTSCLARVREDEILAGRPVYGGRAYAEFSFERGPPVLTLDTEALGTPSAVPGGSPTERTVEVAVNDDERIRHVETFDVPESDLAKARRIVSGGRGLGEAAGFDLIGDLADALDAAMGASRPPADDGWVPYDRQIGVTGKEIDVELYVPCAISGDSYHMRSVNAEYLIPINSDPEAAIFNFADIGIVGDVYEYGPALIDAIEQTAADEATEETPKEEAE